MRYTKEKSLKSRRPNEKASEMKGRIARGLLSVALVGVLTTIMPFNASELYRELERQVTSRANNLPAGSTQEIVLDVRGRGFSKDVIDNVVANIQSRCAPVYKDIPVTVMSY